MRRVVLLATIAIASLTSVLSLNGIAHTEEPAGGSGCGPAVPLDLGQGYAGPLKAPLSIPDNDPGGASNCLTVTGNSQTISDLDVAVDITHTWVGDLLVTLTHVETGTTVVLLDQPGVPASAFGCEGDNVRTTFSDEASDPVEDECNVTPPAIYASLRPQQSLAAFDGESIEGSWRIVVSDIAVGDSGTLDSWSVRPTHESAGENGDVNCSGQADAIDATLLLQIAAGFNFTLQCPENGDVNGNGGVDAIDAALVLQYVAGLIPFLPPLPPQL